jgi:hypothetical protein
VVRDATAGCLSAGFADLPELRRTAKWLLAAGILAATGPTSFASPR